MSVSLIGAEFGVVALLGMFVLVIMSSLEICWKDIRTRKPNENLLDTLWASIFKTPFCECCFVLSVTSILIGLVILQEKMLQKWMNQADAFASGVFLVLCECAVIAFCGSFCIQTYKDCKEAKQKLEAFDLEQEHISVKRNE